MKKLTISSEKEKIEKKEKNEVEENVAMEVWNVVIVVIVKFSNSFCVASTFNSF